MIKDTMLAVRQNEAGGPLIVEELKVPVPGHGEVLIKMAAAPLNPSDLSFIKGSYGSPNSFPVTPGFEGSGTVVATGGGILSRIRMGKRVACSNNPGGDGTWAEYLVTSAMRCIPLSKKISFEQGSMFLVNPMTAMVLMDIALKEKHKAIVNTAAASALGKMMLVLAKSSNIPIINIVRRQEQEKLLKDLGAEYIVNSEKEGFQEVLKEIAGKLNATLILDAIGGKTGSVLIESAPKGSRIIAYAKLSGEKIEIDSRSLLREDKSIHGFQLGNHLAEKGLIEKLKLGGRVRKFLEEQKEISIQKTYPLQDINKAVELYTQNMSAGKVLIKP